jgi:hypothetical protein
LFRPSLDPKARASLDPKAKPSLDPKPLVSQRPAHAASGGTCDRLLVLCETEYYVLRIDRMCRLFVAQRKPKRFEQLSEIKRCFEHVERVLADEVQRPAYKLLVDIRQGPSRNDPEFEAEIVRYRGKLLFGFAKNAAIARTVAGTLQVQRYAQKDAREVFTTTRPEEAFEYLEVPYHEL